MVVFLEGRVFSFGGFSVRGSCIFNARRFFYVRVRVSFFFFVRISVV